MKLIIMSILLLLFSGCTKTIYYPEFKCFKLEKLEQIEQVQIRVHSKEDMQVLEELSNKVRSHISFYEFQVDINNKLCKEKE